MNRCIGIIINVSLLLMIVSNIPGCGEGEGKSKVVLPKEYNKPGNMLILYSKNERIYVEELNPTGNLVWKYTLEGKFPYNENLYEFNLCRLNDGTNIIKMPDEKRVMRIDRDGNLLSELNIENLSFPDEYIIRNVSSFEDRIYLSLEPISEFSRWRIVGLNVDYDVVWQYMVFEDWAYMVEINGEGVQYNIKSIDGTIDLKILPIESISFDKNGDAIIFVDALKDINATDEVDENYVGPRVLILMIDEKGRPQDNLAYDGVGATPGHNPTFPNLHKVNPVSDDKLLLVGADRVGLYYRETGEVEVLRKFKDCYPLGFLGDDKFVLNAYLMEMAGFSSLIISTNHDVKRFENDKEVWSYEVEKGIILDFRML